MIKSTMLMCGCSRLVPAVVLAHVRALSTKHDHKPRSRAENLALKGKPVPISKSLAGHANNTNLANLLIC